MKFIFSKHLISHDFRMGKKPHNRKPEAHRKQSREPQSPVESKTHRKAEISLSRLLTQISHPQMPLDSLQPWTETFFSLFLFIYLCDALWGQYIYMYKVLKSKAFKIFDILKPLLKNTFE